MSNELESAIALFFKYYEQEDDIELMRLYCSLLSDTKITFLKSRLATIMKTRDKSYKMPSISEILAPLVNAEKSNAWESLQIALSDPYEFKSKNVISLMEFLGGRKRLSHLTPYSKERLREEFEKTKYDEFKMFLKGRDNYTEN